MMITTYLKNDLKSYNVISGASGVLHLYNSFIHSEFKNYLA